MQGPAASPERLAAAISFIRNLSLTAPHSQTFHERILRYSLSSYLPTNRKNRIPTMMVKQTTAANMAIVLVAVAWPLAIYGALSQLGDPSPSVPRPQIEAARHLSLVILLTGMLCLIGSLWLSGYAFSAARMRAVVAVAAVIIALTVFVGKMF
jgi:hypothetical protein